MNITRTVWMYRGQSRRAVGAFSSLWGTREGDLEEGLAKWSGGSCCRQAAQNPAGCWLWPQQWARAASRVEARAG